MLSIIYVTLEAIMNDVCDVTKGLKENICKVKEYICYTCAYIILSLCIV